MDEDYRRHWPLADLVLETPRLVLRPDDDAGLGALAEAALAGIHPADVMPFSTPWTDTTDTPGFARGVMQHSWRTRAALCPQDWQVNFLVRRGGRVIGMQSLVARDFAVLRDVETGSWLTMAAQGDGVGTEMRAAVLAFAFDHLGARCATTGAFVDNAASNRISRGLGYMPDGVEWRARREQPAALQRFRLVPGRFARPPWLTSTPTGLRVAGLEACLPLLGAG